MAVHKFPSALKQRVGTSRTYIRPLQKDLDLTPLSDVEDLVCQIAPTSFIKHKLLIFVMHVCIYVYTHVLS